MNPVIVETEINASAELVWSALTEKELIKKWSFEISEFIPRPGFEFRFWGGTESRQWLHICVVKDVVENQKLSYTWRYDGITGETVVTYEIRDLGDKCILRLTHEGLENFPDDIPELARHNFENGWNGIIKNNLKNFIEKKI